MVATASPEFWRGKRVLLTGHTGFKGGWAALWLARMGAEVTGIALAPNSRPDMFGKLDLARQVDSHLIDIRDREAFSGRIRAARPEIVLHMAAQPLVRASYREPVETFATNVMGTVHLMEALRGLAGCRVAVMVTTDKVYHNLEHPYPYREEDALGGYDPYSASKGASEIVIASYRDSFLRAEGMAIASARAGNVIGGGDWSEDRLIPDAVRAWLSGGTLEIRRPQSIRPWQHVLEPVNAYLVLAERLWAEPTLAGAYNIGPHTHEAATVRDVIEQARRHFPQAAVHYGDGTAGPHEAGWLALETARARTQLGIRPRWDIAESIARTMAWYRAEADGQSATALCDSDLRAFAEAI
ncbi:CDP-glucose 4,6-dehydratase [Rhabdaerophilum sp. SD176]|uniref:CDP-glucose 4,6-dehydratase n=1 Tax=Rhabdaerophilum sp. SD176 TaxID=2983548 RepID=UPI0024E040E4|nr:CDP-glucose 4,6-dehydratase [Rhabdaerophilum sp. SD176]